MVHIWGILHRTAECPVVLQGGVAYAYGGVASVHISSPGNPIPKRACRGWVLERLIMKNLKSNTMKETVNLQNKLTMQN